MKSVILVQPPFAIVDIPSVGLGTLKAILENSGIEAKIVYGNLLLAKKISLNLYNSINQTATASLFAEWIFSTRAYPSGIINQKEYGKEFMNEKVPAPLSGKDLAVSEFFRARETVDDYLEEISSLITKERPKIVGFSSLFQQTCASVAIANKLKEINPEIITVLGGSNCLKPMGEVLSDISRSIDYVFSGEADQEFLRFCSTVLKGLHPKNRFIECAPIEDLNSLPYPDYSDFFEQKKAYGIAVESNRICFESSRGCWWGEHSHCLFCGLNGEYIKYREKTPERIKEEINYLASEYRPDYLHTSDCIMPRKFPNTVFRNFKKPAIIKAIHYEVKPL
ncbi:MAG: RiPP maturation radical SAM C-methyltransferase, partial [Candidatus Odinarchaeota archaeon]